MAGKRIAVSLAVLALVACLAGTNHVAAGSSRALLRQQGTRASAVTSSPACESCMYAVHVFDVMLQDPETQNFLIGFMENHVCPRVGNGDKCRNLAEGLIPVILQWMRASGTPLQLCTRTGACTAGKPAAVQQVNGNCPMCTYLVTQIQQMLTDPETVKKIDEAAQMVCQSLPQQFTPSCMEFVSSYEAMIEQMVASADPEQLCKDMQACVVPAQLPQLPYREDMGKLARAVERARVAARAGAAAGNQLGDACDMCKMAVIEAHSLVSNPQVQADLVNYTKALCQTYPSFTDTCMMYVDTYAPLVFSLLQQYLVPDLVCSEINVCPPPKHYYAEEARQEQQQLAADNLMHAMRGALKAQGSSQQQGMVSRVAAAGGSLRVGRAAAVTKKRV